MNNFMYRLSANILVLVSSEEGQDLIEYALLIALVSLAAVAGMNTLATNISRLLTSIAGKLSTAAA